MQATTPDWFLIAAVVGAVALVAALLGVVALVLSSRKK